MKKFLALVGDSQFWDLSSPIIFLGKWCFNTQTQPILDRLSNWELCPYWRNDSEDFNTHIYLKTIYEKYLALLTLILNEVHQENHDIRYWRIFIGIWLQMYIDVMYDRYRALKSAIKESPEFTTWFCAKKDFVIPKDYNDFVKIASESHLFNLQIFTVLLQEMGFSFPEKFFVTPLKKYHFQYVCKELLNNLKKIVINLRSIFIMQFLKCIKMFFGNRTQIYLYQSYLSKVCIFRLFFKSFGAISLFHKPSYCHSLNLEMDHSLREQINLKLEQLFRKSESSPSEFETIFLKLLAYHIPLLYVEGYLNMRESVKYFPGEAKAICSSVGWYVDDYMKLWAASLSETGTLLLGEQHGGGYGMLKFWQPQDFELSILDYYYSWGWAGGSERCQVIPMPVNKFAGQRHVPSKIFEKTHGVLFTTTNIPPYLFRFDPFYSDKMDELIDSDFRFVNALTSDIKKLLRVRLYACDYGRGIQDQWQTRFSHICFENWNIPFIKSLQQSKLYVCDHLSTTFLEAIYMNKPTILFWDPQFFPLIESAKPYFDALEEMGIYYPNAEDAAQQINKIYDHLDLWWYDSKRQAVLNQFRYQFARRSDRDIDEWYDVLDEVLRNGGRA